MILSDQFYLSNLIKSLISTQFNMYFSQMDPEVNNPSVHEGKKYKVVPIQDLERKDQPEGKYLAQKIITDKLNQEKDQDQDGNKKNIRDREIYCFKDTGLEERIYEGSNQFFLSFLIPYNQHGDILLVPDDIWLAISFYLSKYINDNAEQLRSLFVSHQGQKQLVVRQIANSIQQSLEMEKNWDYFFQQIIKQVKNNTKEGVVEALACNFSTTTKVHETISTAIIMDSFKKYFKYTSICGCCGINNVYFDGTREDWVKVKNKLENLAQYDINGQLKRYVSNLSVILDKFIETYDGNVDKNWWNRIIATQYQRGMSGVVDGTYIQGWILHFFGLQHRTFIKDIPCYEIAVPIKLINQHTKTVKQMQLKADWVSVSKVNETTYKPDIGLCIFKNSEEKLQ